MRLTKYNSWKDSNLKEASTDVDPRVEGFRQFLVNKRREARGLQALSQSDKKATDQKIATDADVTPVSGNLNIKNSYISDKKMAEKIVEALKKYGIVNPLVHQAILGVISKESGFNISRSEIPYDRTPNSRIRELFGERVSGLSDDELDALKKNTTKFWDRVYGSDDPTGMSQKYGNTKPGDGAKYLGRGLNGLTFKSNYQKYTDLLRKNGMNADLVANPELLEKPEIAAEVNALYFLEGLASKSSERKYGNKNPNDFKDLTTAVKAATNANAGWGRNIEGTEDLSKALAFAKKLDVEDLTSLA
jgi:predicted chitinase